MRMQHVKIRSLNLLLTPLLAVCLTLSAWGAVKPGNEFPDLTKFGLDGKIPDLKGKIVIVDFWASWCGPCKESFPTMNELQAKYADKGVVVIAVNVDENKSDMEAFLKEHNATFTVLRDARQKLVERTEIATMPSSFILDTEGKVRFVHSGYHGNETKKEYEKEIESLLKK